MTTATTVHSKFSYVDRTGNYNLMLIIRIIDMTVIDRSNYIDYLLNSNIFSIYSVIYFPVGRLILSCREIAAWYDKGSINE